MTTATEFVSVAKVVGVPGLVVLVWYLLELRRLKAADAIDARRSKVEEQKVLAMGEGFRALSQQISAHQTADLESHADMAERLARIDKGLDVAQAQAQARAERQQPNPSLRVLRPTTGETP